MTDVLTSPYLQAAAWAVAGALAYKLRDGMPGGPRMWNWISVGFMLYAVRVGFKVLPFWSTSQEWPQLVRYGLGVVAAGFIVYGFVDYFYRELRPYEEVAQ